MSLDRFAWKIAAGDEKAFADIYENMRGAVFAVCLSVTKNRGVAEEVVQETFVTVWQRSGEFRGTGYKSWILAIAKNKSLDVLRKRKRETPVDFSENEALGGSYQMEPETGIVLQAALNALEETERQIVLLRNTGMKVKDIAAFLGLPRGTVSWRYAEALKKLRRLLEERE